MKIHVIREGEDLNALSARWGLPACMLLRANGLYAPEEVTCETVRWGDNWETLSDRTGETMEALMRLNRYWGAPLPGMRLAARFRRSAVMHRA